MRHALRRLLAGWLLAVGLAATTAAEPLPHAESTQQVLVLLPMPPAHARTGVAAGGGYGDEAGRSARRRLALRLAKAHGLGLVDGWAMPLLGVDCYIMTVPAGRSPEAAAQELSRERGVRRAQASHVFVAQGPATAASDPLLPGQPALRKWRLDDLHELATGRGVRVAVIDSMVDASHPDLAGQIEELRNFVAGRPASPEAHGTGVAGIIAARAHNGAGIMGVAPGARLLALRACWHAPEHHGGDETVCDSLSLAQALHYAIDHRAQVINLSLSGPPDPLLASLIDIATARGVKVVAAYDRGRANGGFPASHPGVIAVSDAALVAPSARVYTAPGHDVPTTQPGGRWNVVDGSSYSAAHVSGLLALLSESHSARAQLRSLVSGRAGGEIDACASLLRVSARKDCACARRAASR